MRQDSLKPKAIALSRVENPSAPTPDEADRTNSPSFILRGTKIAATQSETGLYIVATPIGNLSDITIRALDVLASCDLVVCEDTRKTRRLLERFGIAARLASYHDHSDETDRARILKHLEAGQSVALVSDAGTPLVSDPGFKLVSSAISDGHSVIPIPGPSSVTSALSAAGLPTNSFYFAGFVPNRSEARRKAFRQIAGYNTTLVFLDSPRRLAELLKDAQGEFGDRPAAIAREMTKIHEQFVRGSISELIAACERISTKGELVLLIGPPTESASELTQAEIDARLIEALENMGINDAARLLAQETGLAKRQLYQRALSLRDQKL
ncbi:MAG: 16S rRNA (cytidine(1402)-2'-O)-methyltransferase [Planctomycetota bacterium]